jgi:hypothetical protein
MFVLVLEFIDHLLIVTAANYNSLTQLPTLNTIVTTAHIESIVFTSRFLVTDFNIVCLRP